MIRRKQFRSEPSASGKAFAASVESKSGSQSVGRRRGASRRSGKVLVLILIALPSIFAIVGLVLDSGFMMSGSQDLHHATDAGAMAAAMDLLLGKSSASATSTATTYIAGLNGFNDAQTTVNIPPQTGPYAGQSNFAEVISTRSYRNAVHADCRREFIANAFHAFRRRCSNVDRRGCRRGSRSESVANQRQRRAGDFAGVSRDSRGFGGARTGIDERQRRRIGEHDLGRRR